MIEPMIYKLASDRKDMHYLEPYEPFFNVIGKSYGSTTKDVDIFFNSYKKRLSSTGVMLTGSPGSGKTRIAELLANKCVENGMFAVLVTDLKTTLNTIKYIGMLRNCAIIFDEFGKNFDIRLQSKMLTMFSAADYGKKLFIITENDMHSVNQFIINRPGRVRFHLDYQKMEKIILSEYCADYNVSNTFYKDLVKLYDKAAQFTFDHMSALVEEHLDYPNEEFETILNRLNLSMLKKKQIIRIVKVLNKDDVECKYSQESMMSKNEFLSDGRWLTLTITPPEDKDEPKQQFGNKVYTEVKMSGIKSYIDDDIICIANNTDYTIHIKVIYE